MSLTMKIHIEIVPDRTMETLRVVIFAHVPPNATLITDDFRSHSGLGAVYNHRVINHSTHQYAYTDDDGLRVHTNGIESTWSELKAFVRVRHGYVDTYWPHFLQEYTL